MKTTRALNTPLIIVLALSVFVLGACTTNTASSTPTNTPSAASSTPISTLPGTSSTPTGTSSTPISTSSAASPTPVATQRARISSTCTLPPPTQSPDSNAPAGDIPDSQVFVTYRSATDGYQLKVPEGWARTTSGANVSFVEKLDGLQVSLSQASTLPTTDSVSTNQAIALQQSGQAVRDVCVQDAKLQSGPAVLIVYTSDSAPNPVTGKQVRLENNAYLFFKAGKLATLTLWAPLGADNVDQWSLISRSFRWV